MVYKCQDDGKSREWGEFLRGDARWALRFQARTTKKGRRDADAF
jgi:hypothetical protein